MNYYIEELHQNRIHNRTAGNKARNDIHTILDELGFVSIDSSVESEQHNNVFLKLFRHYQVYKYWERKLSILDSGDCLLIQIPLLNHTLFIGYNLLKLKKRGVRIIVLIHDLESLRFARLSKTFLNYSRIVYEEKSILENADVVISHNSKMSEHLKKTYHHIKLVNLEIFDYLSDNTPNNLYDKSIVVAGNLSKQKSGYLYCLTNNLCFNLYGINYESSSSKTVNYYGSFSSDEIIKEIKGMYSLVWDGNTTETCSGITGEYLKTNSPHKLSLYLASFLPIIIWSKAALAEFVKDNNCGILIDDLNEIDNVFDKITSNEYALFKENCVKLGSKVRSGYYTKKAVTKALSIIK